MKVRATAKFVGTGPRKISLVAELIRGERASRAVQVLKLSGKRAADPVGKVLESAIANAEHNYDLRRGDLAVEAVFVGPGPTIKRFRPRARGSAAAIRKRSSQITVILSDEAVGSLPPGFSKPAEAETPPKTQAAHPKDSSGGIAAAASPAEKKGDE